MFLCFSFFLLFITLFLFCKIIILPCVELQIKVGENILKSKRVWIFEGEDTR